MQKKMKRSEVVSLHNSLSTLGKLSGVKFAYAMAKNTKLLKDEVESVQKSQETEFADYEKERIELAKEHADKDEQGNPIIKNNQYQLTDTKKFTEELEKLQEKHEFKAKQESFNNFMQEEIEVELYTIKQEDIPENITKEQMDIILDLVE